jgi:hypothetical protein
MTELPGEVRLEVKTSRSGTLPIGKRDLIGVGPTGYVIALLNDRILHGPRWVLVRAAGLRARTYDDRQLAELAEASPLAEELNQGWSDWILDREAWSRLLEVGTTGVAERVVWCRSEHPPRTQQSTGAVREMKLASALQEFRGRIDVAAPGGTGSQIEGQIHQALLGDVLEQIGYAITPNPVGVPDIVAKRRSRGVTTGIVSRLAGWEPESARLRAVRDVLVGLDDGEMREVARVICAG